MALSDWQESVVACKSFQVSRFRKESCFFVVLSCFGFAHPCVLCIDVWRPDQFLETKLRVNQSRPAVGPGDWVMGWPMTGDYRCHPVRHSVHRPAVPSTLHKASQKSSEATGSSFFDVIEQIEKNRVEENRNYQRPSSPANRSIMYFDFLFICIFVYFVWAVCVYILYVYRCVDSVCIVGGV